MSSPAPIGLLFLAASPKGLRYVQFMDRKSLKRMIAERTAENPGATWEPSILELKPIAEQLDEYFCGTRERFDLRLDPIGSEFQVSVWRALLSVPFGETRSYAQVARSIGQPNAARAVGLAANQNPLCVVVPCHRVIGADGKLVGYSGGVPRKKHLLTIEARFKGLEPVDGDRVIASALVKVRRAAPKPVAKKKSAKRPAAATAAKTLAAKPSRLTKSRPRALAAAPARRSPR